MSPPFSGTASDSSNGKSHLISVPDVSLDDQPAAGTCYDTSCAEIKGSESPPQSECHREEIPTASSGENPSRSFAGLDDKLFCFGSQFGFQLNAQYPATIEYPDREVSTNSAPSSSAQPKVTCLNVPFDGFSVVELTATADHDRELAPIHDEDDAVVLEGRHQSITKPTDNHQLPRIVINEYASIERCELPHRSYENLFVKPQTLVNEVCGVLRFINARWIAVLASAPGVDLSRLIRPPAEVFIIGARTLQRCYNETLPNSLEEVLALVHIGVAFQRVVDLRFDSDEWNDFSLDLYCWRRALVDPGDVQIFENFWHQLWHPQALVSLFTGGHSRYDSDRSGPQPIQDESPMLQTHQTQEDQRAQMQRDDQEHSFEALMDGKVAQGYSRFLDGKSIRFLIRDVQADTPQAIECANVMAREPGAIPQDLQLFGSFIKPLEQCRSVEMIPEQTVIQALAELSAGRLSSGRELEVLLTSNHGVSGTPTLIMSVTDQSQWSQIPRQFHKKYLDHVAIHCDRATGSTDRNWRYGHYKKALDQILTRHVSCNQQEYDMTQSVFHDRSLNELPNRSLLENNNIFDQRLFARGFIHAQSDLPALPPVGFRASAYNNHPNASSSNMLLTSLQDPRTVDTTACSVTSSDFLSEDSASPTQSFSEPSVPTATSSTRCPRCPQTFTGDPVNQRRNLRRHMFGKHSIDPRLSCSVPGCPDTFAAGRFDNLKRHLEQQHGWTF